MDPNVEAAIQRSVDDGIAARRTENHFIILPTPSIHPHNFQVLVKSDGHVTPEGMRYFELLFPSASAGQASLTPA